MRVFLCQDQLQRATDGGAGLEERLRGCGVEVARMSCLSLCFQCEMQPIARVDGHALTVASEDELVEQVRALATDAA